jgi:very-short-patch-repair endonuclease
LVLDAQEIVIGLSITAGATSYGRLGSHKDALEEILDDLHSGANESIYSGKGSVTEKLEKARTELLDLSARNRLLNMPRSGKGTKTIESVDEKSGEIFRLLVNDGKAFTFVPGMPSRKTGKGADGDATDGNATPDDSQASEDEDVIEELALQDDQEFDERGVAARHADTRLQTKFTPEGLQKRLLDLYYDARTLEDEQGVNVLYLTLGVLRWVDPLDKKNVRHAPLLLIPVSLERGTAGERFKLRSRPEDFAANLSLENFLDRLHGIRLPEVDVSETFDLLSYFDSIEQAIDAKEGWGVDRDVVVLGFFSFAKFMMYRDLDPSVWPNGAAITTRPLLTGLMADGFTSGEALLHEDAPIDPLISPADMLHILDADSSQTLAIHEVRNGRNLVIQGPPGTGKSQTIANLIASAVADGRTVLFVAEKMAALEVVKRRLDVTGVGAACLELHSHRANKRAVLEDLRRTWENGSPRTGDLGSLNAKLTELRDELNGHAARMHRKHRTSGLTPFLVVGQLVRLRNSGEQPNDVALSHPETWTKDEFELRHRIISELVERVREIGNPADHLWFGVKLSSITPMDVERLTARLSPLADQWRAITVPISELASTLETAVPISWQSTSPLTGLARKVASAPLPAEALAASHWSNNLSGILQIVGLGAHHSEMRAALANMVIDDAFLTDISAFQPELAMLARPATDADLAQISALTSEVPPALEAASAIAEALGETGPNIFGDLEELHRLGEKIAAAPMALTSAFADPSWERNPGALQDAVESLRSYREAQAALEGKLTESAWDVDLTVARSVLASHGTGLLKSLSGEWRKANRLVRSCLVTPDQPLDQTLAQLDLLKKGKAAKELLTKSELIASAAFGSLWRGDRSAPTQLAAALDWMLSLGDIGRSVRQIASREPDVSIVRKHLPPLSSLGKVRANAERFTNLAGHSLESLPLRDLVANANSVTRAEMTSRQLFKNPPDTLGARLDLLANVEKVQMAAGEITLAGSWASRVFGSTWNGTTSPWPKLRAACEWVAANGDVLELAGRPIDRQNLIALAEQIETQWGAITFNAGQVATTLELDFAEATGSDLENLPFDQAASLFTMWSQSGEGLYQWTSYRDRAERGRALGCSDIVNRLSDGRLEPDQAVPAFEMAYFEAIFSVLCEIDPEIAKFDGTLHSRKVAEFSDLDLQRIHASADEIVRAHSKRIPPRDGGAIGPLGTLRNELQKKRGHMPIRKLIERAAPALQALKPVFMMSPLSVAQFLTPGAIDFDLLVMDEASQIQPVDALGAVARASQVVVVGDPRQLPPTSFFARMTGAAEEDEDDGGRVADIESILGLFTARGLPMRMLRWHYRSKHQSLIAVSNQQFYESKLFVVPSPYTAEAGMGLRFHHIPDGIFDAGGKRCNTLEAKTVAKAIIQHALDYPDLSLGVAAFSVAQRRAILDELELLRRAHPETEGYFHAHPAEPFFVKNLENVQGDERDVIYISVGYGPTVPGGRVPMRFGPLGTEGGERRLNVLISRAKQRCEVFASMTDEDIDPDFAQTRKGVFAFRLFLHYARTGQLTLAESTGRGHDSVFEEQVANALHERGFNVHRQVGLAGFFIDLAVADPERPGRYLLGIECDGAAYHDALSARDRDRLRQSVLESHGWHIHRIWSTDWFQRPQQELARLVAAIEAAKAEDQVREVKRVAPQIRITAEEVGDLTFMGVESGPTGDDSPTPARTPAYVEAALVRPSHHPEELHEVPRGVLVALVETTVEVEGPVHFDEVVTRIREAWGLKRAGGRIRDAVQAAAEVAERKGTVVRAGDFLSVAGRQPLLRDRSSASSTGLRKPEAIPAEEVAAGAEAIVRANFGATTEQLVTEIARSLGFKATSEILRGRIVEGIDMAISRGRILDHQGLLQLAAEAKPDGSSN